MPRNYDKLGRFGVVVLDTTSPVHFAKAGLIKEFEAFFSAQDVVISKTVSIEMRNKANEFGLPELEAFRQRIKDDNAVYDLDDVETEDVHGLVGTPELRRSLKSKGFIAHEDEDLGEAESVILALRFAQDEVLILDDGKGTDWADKYVLKYQKSFDVAVQMHLAGLITEADCRAIHKLTREVEYHGQFNEEFETAKTRFGV